MRIHDWLMWLCLSLLVVNLQAQSRKELEDKRRRIVRDIEKTDKLLKQNTQNIEASTVRFERLQSQIESRAALIDNIEAEIVASEEIINRNTVVVAALADDVDKMKKAYSRVLRTSFRRKTLSNPMLFVLSAESLNQAFLRWVFLLKYDRYRKKQAEAIRFTQSMLFRRIEEVKQTRIEKENLLIFLQGQRYTLERELSDKDGILKSLENKQSSLKRDLMEKQKAQERLDVAIENIIREEVSKRVDATKAGRVTPTVENPKKSDPEMKTKMELAANQSGAFQTRKGRLPWPVAQGYISRGFGIQRHPTLKNIEITNNGIDIRANESAEVKVIADGMIAGVQFIPGHEYTVIVQHGDYYTVYSNLLEVVSWKKGDFIRASQSLGKLSVHPITGHSELHFEVWKEKERLNPTLWVKN